MFREFAILLCAGIFLCGSASDSKYQNVPAHSPDADAFAAPGDHLALPSDASYQQVVQPSSSYLPQQGQHYSYEVKPAVVQSYGQQAATFSASVASESSSPEYRNVEYAPAAQPINPYYSVPVAAKTVSIGSSGAYNNAQSSNIYAGHVQSVNPAVYSNNVAPPRPFAPAPLVASKTVVESNRAVNIHPPSGYGNQNVVSAVSYSTNSEAQKQYYAVPLSANTASVQSQGGVTAHSPAVATYQVNHVQVNQVPQTVPAPSIRYNVNPVVKSVPVPAVPVASKSVTVESYNSVTAHPPPAPRYEADPALIRYAPVQVPVTKPIPVPVIYPSVETHHSSVQQFAAPTATTYGQQQENSDQLIPVPITSSGVGVKYHSVSVVPNVAHPKGYAKAVVFSPASEVSRVTFNGLGVTYGW